MSDFCGKQWHDMGGTAGGQVSQVEHDYDFWEKRVDALMVVCSSKGIFTVDQLRRALEDMGEAAFESMTYYERWIAAINRTLVETGVYSTEELGAKISDVRSRGTSYGACNRSRP